MVKNNKTRTFCAGFGFKLGAGDRIRTGDLLFTKQLLYH